MSCVFGVGLTLRFRQNQSADFSRLACLSHNLKGTGRGYGFPELARLGATLEQSAGQKDSVALRAQMTELGAYLDKVQLVAKILV